MSEQTSIFVFFLHIFFLVEPILRPSALLLNRPLWRSAGDNVLSTLSASSYDSEGRLTNVTFPTGVVTSLHNDMSSGAVAVDIETSGRDEDVSITTNLSSVDSFYTLVQGTVT